MAEDKVTVLESEIKMLHTELERRGINSRGTTDIFGRPFNLPVNAEHKATVFTTGTLFSCAQPHMRVFWAATFGFFSTFFSVFSPAALGPYLKKKRVDGGLDLDKETLSLAGNLAVSGTIVMRVISGPMCDMWGARKTFIFLLLLAIPGMIILMTAQGGGSFILGRFIIGLSLATFVTCQVWCSQFFERRIVGTVNATAGGWGNVGGGVTLLLMPLIMDGFLSMYESDENKTPGEAVDSAWRLCIVVPLILHLVAALFILTGRDLADGSYAELEMSGAKQKQGSGLLGGFDLLKVGFSNTNALIMLLTYGLCFGVELTMNNKLTLFFHRYYAKPPRESSQLGACFSLMNLFARSWGGIFSDMLAAKFGIRGRIWGMWTIQTLEGIMCLLVGCVTLDFDTPDEPKFKGLPKVPGVWTDNNGFMSIPYVLNSTAGMVKVCGSEYIVMPECTACPTVDATGAPFTYTSPYIYPCPSDPGLCRLPVNGRQMIMDAPAGRTGLTDMALAAASPDAGNCVHNQDTLGVTMLLVIVFSLFVQMAEGLHFGIVPYISRPALGVVSGMVGAGGNMGAVITGQFVVAAGKKYPLDEGLVYLGIVIICLSLTMHLIFFPGEGGMLLPGSFPYDPQWIKPKAGAKGADEVNFENVKTTTDKNKDQSSI